MFALVFLGAALAAAPQAAATQSATMQPQDQPRPRARDLGITIGALPTGQHDAITDVEGVRVGHATLVEGNSIRTGVTMIFPHGEDPFAVKVPAAVFVQNGYGKLMGSTQVEELGELESPIALTNTLSVGAVADALVALILKQPGNEAVRSVNVVVGETNDGRLNDIRGQHVRALHVQQAWASAATGKVAEGCVGAGTGTVCLGWKGGIGTASRRSGPYTVGVLVQTNFGGELTIGGQRIAIPYPEPTTHRKDDDENGSCMIVVATDAPLGARNLERLAQRSFAGMARTGASFSNGSGDYAIAFSTAPTLRIRAGTGPLVGASVLRNEAMSPLFAAVADATEEAIVNSLLQATTTTANGRTVPALPIDALRAALRR